MAKRVQAWTKYRPRLERTTPMTSEELIENIVAATNQSRGSRLFWRNWTCKSSPR